MNISKDTKEETKKSSPVVERTPTTIPIPNHQFPSSSVLVLDSSAIASIFFKERLEQNVVRMVKECDDLSTMDIAYAEVGSVAWKSVMIFKQPIEPIREALRQATNFISDNCNVASSSDIVVEAFELGRKHNLQIYDSLFLALAKRVGGKLLTTDERLHKAVNGIKELRGITILPE